MAKKFKFRLERVLQFKKNIAEEKKKNLLLIVKERRSKEQLVGRLKQQLVSTMPTGEALTPRILEIYDHYSIAVKEQISKLEAEIKDILEREAEAREAYLSAKKEVASLELLKSKYEQEHLEMLSKEENNFLDELSVQRYRFIKD